LSASRLLLGAYTGAADPGLAADFESWLGRRSDYVVEFFSHQAFTGTNTLSGSALWAIDIWAAAQRPDRNMLFSIPLATFQDPSLGNVATGTYDAEYGQVAQAIAASYPNAIIRIGWEFNGSYFPWAAAGRAQDYVAAFRRIAHIFLAASPSFTIDWCPGAGSMSMPADEAYPGDDVVDVIGLDLYDNWNYGVTDPPQRFGWYQTEPYGLIWQRQFAAAHGKRLGLAEWGTNHDDAYFVQQIYLWVTQNHFAYASYWNSNADFDGKLSDGQYPQAGAAYIDLFGALP
jgi:hypothetical protein